MTSSDSILGEKLFEGKHSSIYHDGIASEGLQMLWDDVCRFSSLMTTFSKKFSQ